jgi:hypothetical protein
MVFRGDWIYCADYEAGDFVLCGGQTFMALKQNAGKDPLEDLNAAFWAQMSGPGPIPDHNDMPGLQGGDADSDEMYHGTKDESDAAHSANSPSAANPFATAGDVVTEHNNMTGVQGGAPGERYHGTKNEHDAASYAKDPSASNPFLTRDEMPILGRTIGPFSLAETPDGTGMLYGAAFGNGLHIAVGDNRAIRADAGSPELWETEENMPPGYWRDVAFGGLDVFAAAGMDGRSAWRDTAGVWTLNPVLGGDWKKIVWGNGMFAAVMDGAIMRSPDGRAWTLKTVPSGYGRDIAFGNGYFYICGSGGVMRSADAETWTELDLGLAATWRTVAASGSGDVVVLGGRCAASHDGGTTFAEFSVPMGGWEESIVCDGFFMAIDGMDSCILTETGPIDWKVRSMPNFAVRALSAGNGTVIAVGSRVMTARVIDAGAALIAANGPNGSNPYATGADVLAAKREAMAEAEAAAEAAEMAAETAEAAKLYWEGEI